MVVMPASAQAATREEMMAQLDELESAAQAIIDKQEIENLISRHAHQRKGDALPGSEGYIEVAAEKTPGVCYGIDGDYVYGKAAQRAIRGEDDPVAGKPGTMNMHMITTSHVVVAGDGKTAKGIFYSPGFLTEIGSDGKPKSAWDFKRYSVDFVKEGEDWRIWHFTAYTDFVTPPNVPWTDPVEIGNTSIKYQAWPPETTADRRVRAPAAYATFADTTSACPAESD
jgi:hypothetical protein